MGENLKKPDHYLIKVALQHLDDVEEKYRGVVEMLATRKMTVGESLDGER